jgi:hypothetical protein
MGAMKQQMLEDAEHDNVIQGLRARLYEMSDLFSSFRIADTATSLDLVRGIFRHERIRHPMLVTGTTDDPVQLKAAFDAKYPGHEIPLNIAYEDPEYLNADRFVVVADTLHALADMLSWWVHGDDTDDPDWPGFEDGVSPDGPDG